MRPLRYSSIAALGICLLLAACQTGGQQTGTPPAATRPPGPVAASAIAPAIAPAIASATAPATPISQTVTAPVTSTVETRATLPPGTFVNPVLDQDFPDPDLLRLGDPDGGGGEITYYAFATNSDGTHVQIARSADLVNWRILSDGLPALPDWAVKSFGWTWAPEVTTFDGGQEYVMYYTTRFSMGTGGQSAGTQCIGVATSQAPEGPYQAVGEEPLVCQTGEGGSIDAATYFDEDGTAYLLWKNDGNSGGGQSWIHIQQVAEDGLSLLGEPTRLIKADQVWEGILVEGPTLWKQDGKYYLFYSANDYASPRYAVGYAVADSILGPYEKAAEPLLATNLRAGIVGPGGQDIVLDPDGETWILFHSWTPGGYRNLNIARLTWDEGEPQVEGLSKDPQPVP